MLKKCDFIVFGIIILTSLLMFIAFFGKGGSSVSVTVNGAVYGEYSLSHDKTVKIKTESGVESINASHIIYSEAHDHYQYVMLTDRKQIKVRMTVADLFG